jgi:hypothetical protein
MYDSRPRGFDTADNGAVGEHIEVVIVPLAGRARIPSGRAPSRSQPQDGGEYGQTTVNS